MSQKVSCPLCGAEIALRPFKVWKYGKLDVRRYECSRCRKKFNVYSSTERTYTIPRAH
jgi:transposase-like protein